MQQDKAARFEKLFHETYRRVVAYCRRRSQSVHDADDVVATTYLVAWRRLDECEAADSSLAWLYGVAYRSLSNLHRGKSRLSALRVKLAGDAPPGSPSPDREAHARLELQRAFDALRQLDAYDQEVIRLAVFENLSYKEIGQALDKTESAVRSDLYRARNRLKTFFADDESDLDIGTTS